MRLTLRTLLAYRDGVLAPADHEDLHRRIQQSPDAGNLLRRIQELTSSGDVLTPKLESTGLAGANVIAEYLDDVLTSIRIAELERLFLEYSEHLAELAHCHRMLAEAMQTQVEIPKELHQKAIDLIQPKRREEIKSKLLTQSRKLSKQILVAEVVESSSTTQQALQPNVAQASAGQAAIAAPDADPSNAAVTAVVPLHESHSSLHAAPAATAGRSTQQAGLNLEGASLTNEVPEYLLGSRKRRWQIPAAILALTTILLLLVWQSIGSLDDLKALMLATSGVDSKSNLGGSDGDPREPDGTESKPANKSGLKVSAPADSEDNSKDASTEATSSKGPDVTEGGTSPAPANAVSKADVESNDPGSSVVAGSSADPGNPADPSNSTEPGNDTTVDAAAAASEPSEVIPAWVWKPVDAYESQSVVLFGSGAAMSLVDSVAQPITTGTLVSPPVSRTTFKAGDWTWQSVGASVLNLEVKDARLFVKSSLCRAIVSSSSPANQFTLSTPAGDYEIQLLDKAAWLGIEINFRAVARGSVIEPGTYAPTVVIVVGTDGATTEPALMSLKSLADQQVIKIDSAGRGIAIMKAGQMENFALQSPPSWYRKRTVRAVDQLGMADFHAALADGAEATTPKLRMLAADHRPEVAALAIQTSLLLGDWQPWAAELLANDRMRSHWSTSIELARQLLAANPKVISQLQTELQTKFGADSDNVLKLLIGLPQDEQTNDSLIGLAKGLDSNAMLPIRVLTAYELKRLTGEDFSYQPHAPVRASLQQWRSRLAGGKVQLLPVSDPISERYPK